MNLEKVDNALLNEYKMLLEIPETRGCLLHTREELKIVFKDYIEKYNQYKLRHKQGVGDRSEALGENTIPLDPVEEKEHSDNIISMYMNKKQLMDLLSNKEAHDFFSYFCSSPDYRQMILHEFQLKVKPLLKQQHTAARGPVLNEREK